MNAPSSIPSGTKFSQSIVNQSPRFEKRKMFRKQLRRGRPSKRKAQQHWIK